MEKEDDRIKSRVKKIDELAKRALDKTSEEHRKIILANKNAWKKLAQK
jgi:hypothetical protein